MISIVLKAHKNSNVTEYPGFSDGSLSIPSIQYGTTIQTVINNLNEYRSPKTQIKRLYNQYGKEIYNTLWSIPIQENMTFYVNQPK